MVEEFPRTLCFLQKGFFWKRKYKPISGVSPIMFSHTWFPEALPPRRGMPLNLPLHDEFSSYHLLPSVVECYIFFICTEMLITRSPVSRTHANAYWSRWKKAQLPGSPTMQWYLRRESLHFNWSRCGDSESWARHARLEVWSGCRFARIDLIFEVMGPIAYLSYTYLRPGTFFHRHCDIPFLRYCSNIYWFC